MKHDKIVTVASCFVLDPDGRVLFLRRHPDDFGGGLWATPAGKIEADEEAEAAVLREVWEETGIELLAVERLGAHVIHMPHGSNRLISFKAITDAPEPVVLRPDEHDAYQWFDLATLLAQQNIIWAAPTLLRDFGLMPHFDVDPTLADGSFAERELN